jgi:hypothetical protein
MIVGGYELHLYCDHKDHTHAGMVESESNRQEAYSYYIATSPGQFGGNDYGEARRTARRQGWHMGRRTDKHPSGFVLCPKHNPKRK